VAETRAERRLTTILAADVVGYSRLMAADEAGTLAQLKALRKEIVEPKTTEFNGRVVKLMGDGTLMEFVSVVDALTSPSRCSAPWRSATTRCRKTGASPTASASTSATLLSKATIFTATG
jgi:adenylate cyclase